MNTPKRGRGMALTRHRSAPQVRHVTKDDGQGPPIGSAARCIRDEPIDLNSRQQQKKKKQQEQQTLVIDGSSSDDEHEKNQREQLSTRNNEQRRTETPKGTKRALAVGHVHSPMTNRSNSNRTTPSRVSPLNGKRIGNTTEVICPSSPTDDDTDLEDIIDSDSSENEAERKMIDTIQTKQLEGNISEGPSIENLVARAVGTASRQVKNNILDMIESSKPQSALSTLIEGDVRREKRKRTYDSNDALGLLESDIEQPLRPETDSGIFLSTTTLASKSLSPFPVRAERIRTNDSQAQSSCSSSTRLDSSWRNAAVDLATVTIKQPPPLPKSLSRSYGSHSMVLSSVGQSAIDTVNNVGESSTSHLDSVIENAEHFIAPEKMMDLPQDIQSSPIRKVAPFVANKERLGVNESKEPVIITTPGMSSESIAEYVRSLEKEIQRLRRRETALDQSRQFLQTELNKERLETGRRAKFCERCYKVIVNKRTETQRNNDGS